MNIIKKTIYSTALPAILASSYWITDSL